MHPHALLIRRFYAAFDALDGRAMQACYAPDAQFRDPVFELTGAEQIGAMWQMLCESAKGQGADGWRLAVSAVEADGAAGRAHWEPHYRFGPKGRRVHNVIDAVFTFRDGLIATHVDEFDFWRWSRQALGAPGWWLGWTPWMRGQVRRRAIGGLARWQNDRTGTQPRA